MTPEDCVKEKIMTWLLWNKYLAIVVKNTATYDTLRKVFRSPGKYFIPGVPDICVILPMGRVWWIEVKSAKGRVEAPQAAFHAMLTDRAHWICVARSLEEAQNFASTHGIKP